VSTERDAHYTPASIAKGLIGSVGKEIVEVILDPSVGSGELLSAASERWPNAEMLGCDIDPRVSASTRRFNSNWRISNADFLSPRSRSASVSLRSRLGEVDLALLNPPFSCRGGKGLVTEFDGCLVRCSPGLAFVLGVHKYIKKEGEIAALLPAGTVSNQKDQHAWDLLKQHYCVEVLEEHHLRAFPNVATRVVSVLLTRRSVSVPEVQLEVGRPRSFDFTVGIERGTYAMYRLKKVRAGLPLIHSTDLRHGTVNSISAHVGDGRRKLSRPAVIIQRVGLPDRRKVAILEIDGSVVLSDCLIGLTCSSDAVARKVRKRLLDNWSAIEQAFGGSCAPFITLEKLESTLQTIGIGSVRPSAKYPTSAPQ
jgi:predicted RNA methylase